MSAASLPLMLKSLRLPSIARHWQHLAQRACDAGLTHTDYLQSLCELELADREQRRLTRYRREAKLPPGKSLASFDFTQANSINRPQIEALAQDSSWVKAARNLLMFGASGVGKTHLACAIADSLIQHGIRVRYVAATDLVQQLQRARSQHCLDEALNKLDRFELLLLDDIGYVRKDEAETRVLFELIAHRYESSSLMITANQPFSEWDQIFTDTVITVAAIDRLVHHATIIEIKEESYRKKVASGELIE